MKLINWWIVISIAFIFFGCGSGNGKLYVRENLDIFYTQEIQFEYIESLGDFFENNGLIHPTQKHSIKLTSNSDSFVLKMILNDSLKTIPSNMLNELALLEEAIALKVFKNLNFAIEITDAYFNPIINK
jgi:hypothetical protein